MPRKKKTQRRRRMMGGRALKSLGENNIAALERISVGENNLNAIKSLQEPKPPLQPTGQVVNVAAMPYPQTGSVPLLDKIRGALKRSKVISRGARALKLNKVADFAEQHGYGCRCRRRQRGRGSAYLDKYGNYIHAF